MRECGDRAPPAPQNNPDDIGLLQELSRKDAELHLAYAAHLYSAEGRRSDAETQWESGCIRLEAYVSDGMERLRQEALLLEKERTEAQGLALKASSVAGNPFNNDYQARFNGLDPQSPYVTQRPQRSYFWYKGESCAPPTDRTLRPRAEARGPQTLPPCCGFPLQKKTGHLVPATSCPLPMSAGAWIRAVPAPRHPLPLCRDSG